MVNIAAKNVVYSSIDRGYSRRYSSLSVSLLQRRAMAQKLHYFPFEFKGVAPARFELATFPCDGSALSD